MPLLIRGRPEAVISTDKYTRDGVICLAPESRSVSALYRDSSACVWIRGDYNADAKANA